MAKKDYSQSICTKMSIRIILLVIWVLNIDMKLGFYFYLLH